MKIWDADRYARNARFVSDLGAPLVELLAPKMGERILDLGCGDGALTERLTASGADVVGFDASDAFVAAARARGIDVRLGDAQRLPFVSEFDAVFTNAALHWMHDAPGVIAGVARALRSGGRFVGEFGAHGNVAAIATALIAALEAEGLAFGTYPWFLPTPRLPHVARERRLRRNVDRVVRASDAASDGLTRMARNVRRSVLRRGPECKSVGGLRPRRTLSRAEPAVAERYVDSGLRTIAIRRRASNLLPDP